MTERMFQAWEAMSIPRFFDGGGGMEIFYDNGYFEIFAEGGLAVFCGHDLSGQFLYEGIA